MQKKTKADSDSKSCDLLRRMTDLAKRDGRDTTFTELDFVDGQPAIKGKHHEKIDAG